MCSYIELGATLFIPASFSSLNSVVNRGKYPQLKSLVIDFEDGLERDALKSAMQNIGGVLEGINENSPLVFLRARDEMHLEELLLLESIKNITGFVLAKFSLSNAERYFKTLEKSSFLIMPSVEGRELFNQQELHKLKEKILTCKERVVLVRFGLEDMLRQLRMRRKCSESIFDFAATSSVIGNYIATFKSAGFAISGGVYPCFKDEDGFIKDVKRDLREGLFSKTIIHPSQIEIVNELYKVSKLEYEEALQIEVSQKRVFNQNGKMAETPTMLAYSQEILKRAKMYGIRV